MDSSSSSSSSSSSLGTGTVISCGFLVFAFCESGRWISNFSDSMLDKFSW